MGTEVLRSAKGVILNKRKYILELISDVGLSGVKRASTPMECNLRLTSIEYDQTTGLTEDVILHDVTPYQRLIGKLLYATNRGVDGF